MSLENRVGVANCIVFLKDEQNDDFMGIGNKTDKKNLESKAQGIKKTEIHQ